MFIISLIYTNLVKISTLQHIYFYTLRERYTDVYSYSTGNPNLIAFYPNIAEVYYSYKNSLWSNISYESAKSKITDYYSLLSDSITTLSTKANIGEYQKIKFAVGYNKKITNWLNYRSSFSYTTGHESITFPDLNQNRFNYNAYTLWLSPLIKLVDFTVTPNFYYSSDVHYSATKTLNYWYLDFDIRYNFSDNLEFSFVARDIFLTGITRNISKYQNIDIRLRNNWDSRLFTVGFSYFIGNDKVKNRKREPSANKDNLNRLRELRRFINYTQFDAMDCGPTCLKMVAQYYGKPFPLNFLRDQSRISKNGVSLFSIREAAESIGFEAEGVIITIEQLKTDVDYPIIIHWDRNHFVVLKKITINKRTKKQVIIFLTLREDKLF